ncbi:MAG TPA: MFS transporter [Gammaproteobacteria bacterium]|nr:MFS transporter [Gammaproteobacteria bacterium]
MSRTGALFATRQLDHYPTGGRRIFLLFVAVVATVIASYEAQIAPVLPLLMKDIGMSLQQYGFVVMSTVIFAALGAMLFGPVCDRRGRTTVLIPALFGTAVCVFAMTLVDSVATLFVVRAFLGFIEGAVIAASAGLVRDFSPRMGRAVAYGFWTFGPVGSSFMAAAIAGYTLPFLHTWQSQFYIAGGISLVVAVFVLFTMQDLAPEVRHRIMHTASQAVSGSGGTEQARQTADSSMRAAMRYGRVWAMIVGVTLFLMLYLTLQQFGPKILVDAYHYSPDEAAYLSQYFWLLNLITLIGAGVLSDRLQRRKIVSFVGSILTLAVMLVWIPLAGSHPSEGSMIALMSLLGGFFGVTFAPWMAWFSETLEDISTAIQASGWALWTAVLRIYVVITVVPMTFIAQHFGWAPWLWATVGGVVLYILTVIASRHTPWLRRQDAEIEEHVYVPETIAE